ncbi:MAG: hypothetical protein LBP25_05090 [Tannerellaceae bacterium]|jgi:hypothetical protein|nr:hypothetical protein [Tannerellaceae bacterium]
MDNLGDWLYIVVLVIAGISSLLSSVRKRKQSAEVPGLPGSDPEPACFPPEEILLPPPSMQKAKVKTPKKKSAYTSFREGERTLQTAASSAFPESSDEDNGPGISSDTFQDMEEVKKAILYSEIFRRKY